MRAGGDIQGLGDLRWDLVAYTRGAGIELGYGPVKAFPHFVGVREASDDTKGEHPDYVCDDFHDLSFLKDDSLDFVVEHEDAGSNSQEIERVLKHGGYLCVIRAGKLFVYTHDADLGLTAVDQDAALRECSKTVLVIRYGAIGDTLQASSILPALKQRGYHVTWLCEPTGRDYLKADPHIDAFIVNDKDQVPNHELPAYWARLATRYDRVINLCESVEGSLIKLPGRADFNWPHALREEMCNQNYLEFIAKMADLPFHPEHHFYETEQESAWADKYIARITKQANRGRSSLERTTKPYVVMFALAGSSVHKFYPHTDAIIARLMLHMPEAHVILVGDAACAMLEAGWENEPRIHRESGRMGVRETLALAKRCQLVIGPETGVLNAVAFDDIAKIALLSHSSPENLTKHWVDTYPVASASTKCWPCHRMHYTREHCPEDKQTGAAMCMAQLDPDVIWSAVEAAHSGWIAVRKMMETV